ncbi:PREDICTED: LOW QUALITY PROTEIN: probable E3 ubiquitin-protein ligase HERC4, partial [Priapulus caudatus]|uniref:LOW QUALITY PROTEIN: probable E3 ubiquitin-protein ligase HERC4 n=1 Tax=Priapulus caudatus TaxID=37621 RepID=A0ABM1F2G5_PRICU
MYTYGWGNHSDGQLGLGGIEDVQILVPKSVACLRGKKVREAACGLAHTLLLLRGGALYSCGCNDFGQLGHERPRRKPALHSLALGDGSESTQDRLASVHRGARREGQLGHGLPARRATAARRDRGPPGWEFIIVQVACGHRHSVALSRDGVLYSWGANQHGELGHGTQSPQEGADVVRGLAAVPVHGVAAGGAHSMLVTVGGSVYGWGSNRFGQLGLGDEAPRGVPTVLRSLKFQKVRHVACGEDHTVALTTEGGVFTFGAGMYGQLGHNSKNSERLPRKVFELMGSEVCQIACG